MQSVMSQPLQEVQVMIVVVLVVDDELTINCSLEKNSKRRIRSADINNYMTHSVCTVAISFLTNAAFSPYL